MGLSLQNGCWGFRHSIGQPDSVSGSGHDTKNVNGEKVTGINKFTPWAYLYGDGYALIKRDKNGVELSGAGIVAKGPTGIF